MTITALQREAQRLRLQTGQADKIPVNLQAITERLGIDLVTTDLEGQASGLLITGNERPVIVVHEHDGWPRQRFTIAHELGHFWLRHQFDPGAHVHVDHGYRISARGMRSVTGTNRKEIEANQFAAALLMPVTQVRDAIRNLGTTFLDDTHVTHLATAFEVSEQAMAVRLQALGYL